MSAVLIVVGCIALVWTLVSIPVGIIAGRCMRDPDEDQDVIEYVRLMNEAWKEREPRHG